MSSSLYRRLGGDIAVKRRPPTGKSVSVSCSCRACGRGEAACDPPVARPKQERKSVPRPLVAG
eukprot:3190263-Pyramimonas_sp.AAC.1